LASRRFRARKTLNKTVDQLQKRLRYVEKRTSKTRLKPRAVTTEKLYAKTVTTAKIADNAVTEITIAENAVGTIQIQPGSVTTNEINFAAGDIGGSTSYRQNGQPVSPNTGDVWFDTDDSNKMYQYDGTAWTSVRDATIAVAQAAANAGINAAATANAAAIAAQSTADGKNKVYRQGTQPTAPTGGFAVGDLWFDTANDNRISRWDGSTWAQYGLGNAAIANLDAGKISTGFLAADRIQANSLDAAKITAGTITTDRFSANTINASVITAGTITGVKLSADSVDGKTITGATVQTSAGGTSKVVLNTSGLRAIDSGGTTTVSINTDGTASFSGTVTATSFTATGLVDANDLASNSVTNAKIENGAITNAKISDLSADKINAGSINAAVISVTSLNADNLTAGNITARNLYSAGSSVYGLDLEVNASSSPFFRMKDSLNDLVELTAINGLRMRYQNNAISTRINLTDPTNRFQIDTNNSTYAVEVGGSVNATGQLRCGGSAVVGGNLSVSGTITGTVATANSASFLGSIGAGGYLRSNVSDSHSGGTLSVSVLSIGSTVSISAGYGVTSNWSPNVANSLSVGQSSRPWNSVYAQDTTINTSDARGKTDIELSPLGLEFVNALRPVKFRRTLSHNVPHVNEDGSAIVDENGEQTYTSVPGTRPHYGFIAQEIKETYPRFVDDFGGWVIADPSDPDSSQFLRYTEFISPIVKAIQELSEKVVSLEARIQEMEG
jgi:hypothetical protein